MAGETRTTIAFHARVYRALKTRAATSLRSLSVPLNAAVAAALREEALDLDAFATRRKAPRRPFGRVLEDLGRDGLLSRRCPAVGGA